MDVRTITDSAGLLLHPVRLRIVQAFLGGRRLTTAQLRTALPDVSPATLYRQVVDEPFDGYQMRHSYRLREEDDDEGMPLTRMRPRSLLVPPGIPEFLSRRRIVAAGRCELRGRAWSGIADISGVEVSTDDGESWSDAEVERDGLGRWAWRAWRLEWDARPGEFVLCSRARDAAGNVQPLEPSWNVGGYANNAVQRVAVTVTG